MAFNVLIADDERMVREGLTKYVPWEEFGFHIAGTAENGIDALNMIRSLRPDLLLTDVRMPFLSGIELIERAKKIKPDISIIVLSGYDEFEYVQKAINSGASGYLLKPLNLDTLKPMLINIKEDLINQQQMDSMITDLTASSMKLLDAKKEQVLRSLMFDLPLDEEETLADLGIYHDDCCVVGIIKADDSNLDESEKKKLYKNMKKCAEEAVQHEYITIINSNSPTSLIYILLGMSQTLSEISEKIRITIAEHLKQAGINAAVSHSDIHRSVYSLNKAYDEAMSSADSSNFMSTEHLMLYEFEEISPSILLDRAQTDAFINRISEVIAKNSTGSHMFDTFLVSNVYVQIQKLTRDMEVDIRELVGSPAEFYKNICSKQKIESRLEALKDVLLKLNDYIVSNRNNKTLSIIEKTKQFIADNYSDRDLSLQKTAEHCAITPNYLSYIFKQNTDMNFSEYLSQFRIKKAEELLLFTDKTVYEIAELVGYDNSAYFCTVFKKTVGHTPSFYRSKNSVKE
ncbi:MAG: response regulator [Christensenellaceae bacterium]|nr:response regulator [Christensenellaceae bacterium]